MSVYIMFGYTFPKVYSLATPFQRLKVEKKLKNFGCIRRKYIYPVIVDLIEKCHLTRH